MSGRAAILNKPGTAEINRLTAEKLGVSVESIRDMTRAYWMDIEQMFLSCSGHGTYVEHFGHFILYTKGVYGRAREIERVIKKKLRYMSFLERDNVPKRKDLVAADVAKLMSQIILLSYSIRLYKDEVLSTYPKKYKVASEKGFNTVVKRLEKLFDISIYAFPLTISYPIQKIFVQKLRNAGVLQNPVVDQLKRKRKVVENSKV